MTAAQYLILLAKDKTSKPDKGIFSPEFYELSDAIDKMSHLDRIVLRTDLDQLGCKQIMRNLYYDYNKQTWI